MAQRHFERSLLGAVGVILVASWLAPRAPIDLGEPYVAAFSYALSFSTLCAGLLAVAFSCDRVDRGRWLLALVSGIALASTYVLAPAPTWLGVALVDAAILSLGLVLGTALGRRVTDPGHIVVVAYVSSIADITSVLVPGAPTQTIAASASLLSVMALSFPIAGATEAAPLLGIGDVVFVGLYLAIARTHGLSLTRSGAAMMVAFVGVLLLVVGLQRPIPALPALGLAMVLVHPRARHVAQAERRQALLGSLALTALVSVFWWRAFLR